MKKAKTSLHLVQKLEKCIIFHIIYYYRDYKVFEPTEFIDESTKKSFERIQRGRIERKLLDLQLQRGILNIKEINNVNDLFRDNKKPPMNFYINTQNDKVTFDIIMTEEEKENIKQQKITEGKHITI